MVSSLVVILTPRFNQYTRFTQTREPVVVETLVAEFSIKALDIRILCRLARLCKSQRNPTLVSPGIHSEAREFGAVINTQPTGQWTMQCNTVQHPRYT